MINKIELTNKFIEVVISAVGDKLSTLDLEVDTTPSVIKSRYGGPVPDTPYIVVDIIAGRNKSHNGISEYINTDNNTVYSRLTEYLISFRCFGGDADNILQTLNTYFDLPSVRDGVRAATNGAVISIDDPISVPQNLTTEFIESSSFTLIWGGTDETIDTNSTVITTITVEETFENP